MNPSIKEEDLFLTKIQNPEALTSKQRGELVEILTRLCTPLKKDLNASDELIEFIYELAYKIFNVGDYEKAAKLFQGLTVLNHLDARFWKGLAASRKLAGELTGGAEAYLVALALDLNDADAYLHGSECLIAIGEFSSAKDTLKRCLEITKEDPKAYEDIQLRAEALVQALQRKTRNQSKKSQ